MPRPRIDTLLQMRTLRAAMTDMAMQTVGQIRDNFYTQGIFPFGEAWHGQTRPWTNANGWFEENKRREGKPNAWHSTGEGVESFHWQVTGDLDNDNLPPRSLTFDFFYAEHLKFAEMGVGKGRPYSKSLHRMATLGGIGATSFYHDGVPSPLWQTSDVPRQAIREILSSIYPARIGGHYRRTTNQWLARQDALVRQERHSSRPSFRSQISRCKMVSPSIPTHPINPINHTTLWHEITTATHK